MAYVYRHIRKDTGKPFYIGIGSDNNYSRANVNKGRNKHWNSIVKKSDYLVEIVIDDLTWDEACKKEVELISLYGRRDLKLGTLVNLTNGGDGLINPSIETRAKIGEASSKRSPWNKGLCGVYSDEYRKKISDSRKGCAPINKGNSHTEEAINKMRKPRSDEFKKTMSIVAKNRPKKTRSEETKQKMRDARILYWKNNKLKHECI